MLTKNKMKITDFTLNEFELISYRELREKFWTEYCEVFEWLSNVSKLDRHQLSQHWVDPELIQQYLMIKQKVEEL